VVVEITAPPAVLAARLAARGRESAADIEARLARQVGASEADVVLVNDGPVETGGKRFVDALLF
jgi:ribose 1,5-bisphosphokinase PhnN